MPLNNVPQPGQTLASSQTPIQTNFSTIATAFAIDHVDYNIAGQGFHNKVTFPSQGTPPVFSNPQIGIYNAVGITTVNELFIVKGSGTAIPITATVNDGAGSFLSSGYYYLPSGLLVKYGSFTNASINPNTQVTVQKSFPVGATIPVFSSIYSVQLTLGNNENPGQPWQAIVAFDRYNSDNTKLSIFINNQSGNFISGQTGLLRIYYTAIGI